MILTLFKYEMCINKQQPPIFCKVIVFWLSIDKVKQFCCQYDNELRICNYMRLASPYLHLGNISLLTSLQGRPKAQALNNYLVSVQHPTYKKQLFILIMVGLP